jgi:flavin-dependent dehydrogenase
LERYDAAIIGGGPAGSTLAILLARSGWSVILFERKAFPRRKVCGEYLSATNWPVFEELGIASTLAQSAGPPVREVGLLVGKHVLRAELPKPDAAGEAWGCALGREHLDTLLLAEAARLGVNVRQPWTCMDFARDANGFVVQASDQDSRAGATVGATLLLAAHGSWNPGSLATQPPQRPQRGSELFGFKAHFRQSGLPDGLMPLLSFPGGYGGLVHCDAGRTSLSLCIRRDRLQRLPREPHRSAGEAVFDYLLETTPALRDIVANSDREGAWLSAGPIRPGIRRAYRDGVFLLGNAAGEAHPAVAEGISMALQSAWILSGLLTGQREAIRDMALRNQIGAVYQRRWRSAFAPRIHAASAIAQWAMHPKAVTATLPFIRNYPALLTWGARQSGKATEIVRS